MSDDKMRAEFEKWADSQCLPLTRINWDNGTISEYAYTATFDAWQVWQVAYQAGLKAEREAIQCECKSAVEDIVGEAAFSGLPESKQKRLLRLIGQDYKPEGDDERGRGD